MERIERLEEEAEGITTAERMAVAFHEPRKLAQERQAFRARAGLLAPVETAMQEAVKIAKAIERNIGKARWT